MKKIINKCVGNEVQALNENELMEISGGFEWNSPEGCFVEGLASTFIDVATIFTKKKYFVNPNEKTKELDGCGYGYFLGQNVGKAGLVGLGAAAGAGIVGAVWAIKNKLAKK